MLRLGPVQQGVRAWGQPLGPGWGAPAQPGTHPPLGRALRPLPPAGLELVPRPAAAPSRPGSAGAGAASAGLHHPLWPAPLPVSPLAPSPSWQGTCWTLAPLGWAGRRRRGQGAGTSRSLRGSQAEPGPAPQLGCEGVFYREIKWLLRLETWLRAWVRGAQAPAGSCEWNAGKEQGALGFGGCGASRLRVGGQLRPGKVGEQWDGGG